MKINLAADPVQSRPSQVKAGEGARRCSLLGYSSSVTPELFGYSWRAERKNKDFLFQGKSQG